MAIITSRSDGRDLSQHFLLFMNNTEEVQLRDLRIIRANSKSEVHEFLIGVEANKISFLTQIAEKWYVPEILKFSEDDFERIDKSKPPAEQDWPEDMIHERFLSFFHGNRPWAEIASKHYFELRRHTPTGIALLFPYEMRKHIVRHSFFSSFTVFSLAELPTYG
jgi:hypothetical protein